MLLLRAVVGMLAVILVDGLFGLLCEVLMAEDLHVMVVEVVVVCLLAQLVGVVLEYGVGVRNGIAALAATLSRGALLTVNAIPGAGAAPGANAPPGAVSATATSLPRPSSGATATLPGGGAPAGAVPTATSGAALPMPLGPATSGASRGYVAVWPRSAEVDDQSIQGLE